MLFGCRRFLPLARTSTSAIDNKGQGYHEEDINHNRASFSFVGCERVCQIAFERGDYVARLCIFGKGHWWRSCLCKIYRQGILKQALIRDLRL